MTTRNYNIEPQQEITTIEPQPEPEQNIITSEPEQNIITQSSNEFFFKIEIIYAQNFKRSKYFYDDNIYIYIYSFQKISLLRHSQLIILQRFI